MTAGADVAAADLAGLTGNARTQFLSGIASWAMDIRIHTDAELHFLAEVAAGRASSEDYLRWLTIVVDDMPAPPPDDYVPWPGECSAVAPWNRHDGTPSP